MEKVSFTSKPPFCNSMLGSDEFNLNETVIPHCKSEHGENSRPDSCALVT